MDRRLKEVGAVSYISTDAFNGNFFNYVITSSPPTYVKVGSLVPVTGATSVNCPAGHVLRENGKKLYPGAHSGVVTYMVGVFDIISGLKGYINPNDPMFAPYNTDRPLYQPDSVYTTDGQTKNLGPSVFTLGQVGASGDITTASNVIANDQIRSSTVTDITATLGDITLDPTVGQVFTLTSTLTGGITLKTVAGSAVASPGAVLYVMITNGGGRTFVGDGTSVVTSASATLTNGKPFSITLVSDGQQFREMSRVQYA